MEQFDHLLKSHPWIESAFEKGFRVLVIIAVVFGCAKLIHVICEQILSEAHKVSNESQSREREKRLATVIKLVEASLRVILFGAATLMVLREIGLDITPLLTGAGIAGVAVGFGAQSLVKDVISGFFLLIENQIRVGDVIKVNAGLSGAVERMQLRVTAIRDGDGTLHVVPNGEIKSVSNMTYDFGRAVVNIHVPYQVDLKRLSAILSGVATGLDQDPRLKSQLRGRPEFAGIVDFQPLYMTVQVVAKTEPHARWSIAREIRERALVALGEANIPLFTQANAPV